MARRPPALINRCGEPSLNSASNTTPHLCSCHSQLVAPWEIADSIRAFEWVSCPNYLGEMTEWAGWALATWSLPGLAFAAYTAANLAPRALAHHDWYRERFPDYPPRRRALIPYLL